MKADRWYYTDHATRHEAMDAWLDSLAVRPRTRRWWKRPDPAQEEGAS